jgi:hypothetical protein
VGQKPPQSQKGGSHGLTPWTSAGLSPKEEKNLKNLKIYKKNLLFAVDLAQLRQAACAQQEKPKKKN